MIWLTIYLLVVLAASIFAYKKMDGFLFYTIAIVAFIAPYSGITIVSFYSLCVRIFIPSIVICYIIWKRNDLVKLLRFSFRNFLYLTILVFALYAVIILYDRFVLGISLGQIPFGYLIKYFELFWSILFFLILFARVDSSKRLYSLKKIYLVVLTLASLIGFLTYLKVPIVYSFHEEMYNYVFEKYGADQELFDFVRWYNRPYSIFSASNQFGLFATLSLIVSLYLYDENVLNKITLSLTVVLQFLILISSQSRTGFLVYVILLFIVLMRRTNLKQKIISLPLLVIVLLMAMNFLPDRVADLFSSEESIVEGVDTQRIYFWIKFYNSLSIESIFNGMPRLAQEKDFTFFESGYLNIYFEGGMGLILLHFAQIRKIGVIGRDVPNLSRFGMLYSFVFLFSEIFQGTFINVRYGLFNGLIIAYIIINTYEFHTNKLINNTP